DLLERAGFEHVLDASRFRPEPLDEGRPSDWVLPAQGPDLLRGVIEDGEPFFLHVHAANAHMPYRVVDRRRFSRHSHDEDLGRFLDSIEETDAILSAFYDALSKWTLSEKT